MRQVYALSIVCRKLLSTVLTFFNQVRQFAYMAFFTKRGVLSKARCHLIFVPLIQAQNKRRNRSGTADSSQGANGKTTTIVVESSAFALNTTCESKIIRAILQTVRKNHPATIMRAIL
jgi:hypothetical protein